MKICAQCKETIDDPRRRKFCSDKCSETYWSCQHYTKNRDKILAQRKTSKHREKERKYNKTPARRKYHNEYMKKKKRTDPIWRLKHTIWDRIRKSSLDGDTIGSIESHLGYTIQDLYEYLAHQPEYDEARYLSGELVLDHIIPYHWFLVLQLGDAEFKKCWNMRNLRIIPKSDNLSRGRKQFDWDEVDQLGLSDLLPCGADVIYQHRNVLK